MKRLKCNYYAKMTVIAMLAFAGLAVLSAEPVEMSWHSTLTQLGVCALCWGAAAILYSSWDISRISKIIERMERPEMF